MDIFFKFLKENYFAKKPKTRNAKKSIQPSRKSQNFDIHENKVNLVNKINYLVPNFKCCKALINL